MGASSTPVSKTLCLPLPCWRKQQADDPPSSPYSAVREQNFNANQRRLADKQFHDTSEAEMRLKEEFERSKQEAEERKRAEKSVRSTPRVAGVGTPVVKRTPRRVGL